MPKVAYFRDLNLRKHGLYMGTPNGVVLIQWGRERYPPNKFSEK